MYQHILCDVSDDVAFIRLNAPDTLNAMTTDMGRELLDAIGQAPRSARAIVLGGVGRAFCSGANLSDGSFKLDDPDRDAGAMLEAVVNPLALQIRRSPIPVVTAVRGAVAGVGCALALMGDLIVAGENAYFFQAFSRIGLSPDGGSTFLLAKAIGRVRAMEMMLLATRLPAAQALDWGLVNRVVADDAVEAAAIDLARQLARGPASLGLTRAAAWAALENSFEDALALEREIQRIAGRTADFVEGIDAFQTKRAPVFRGR